MSLVIRRLPRLQQFGWQMPKRRARNHSAADLLAGVDQNRVSPRFALTDEQWRKTAKLSGIPETAKLSEIPEGADKARHYIETTIGIFRESQASDLDRVTPAEIRKQLEAQAKLAHDLYSGFSKLVDEPDAYAALTGKLDERRRSSDVLDARRLSEILGVLSYLDWLLSDALGRVETDKRGPKAKNIYRLVGNLDGIREHHTGKKITRSYKDDASKQYITYVSKIADPDIGDGTIEKAMKDRIKRRG
jgi:hypothetical protein